MKILEVTNELKEKAIKELLIIKKETGRDWSKVIMELPYIDDAIEKLYGNPKEYKIFKEEILEKLKKRFSEESQDTRGISVKKENWCWPNHLYREWPWNIYEESMFGWPEARRKTLTSQTFEIVNYLTDPRKQVITDDEKRVKGLVYGNVQSGKTAHIASLIALYAAMDCPLIIVFSGVTKNLRLQTENRLRKDLGIDKYGTFDLITAETDLLSNKTPKIEGKLYQNRPSIGVFKKSPAALSRLLKYLQDSNDENMWQNKQVLIIDDECDQYGPNNKSMYTDDEDKDKPYDRSTINNLLVKIMNVFNRYCYVGFTATPFANILNELPGKDSIYPKDFIYSLELNDRYYGAQKVFGLSNEDPEKEPRVLNSINYITKESIDPKNNSYENLPDDIKDAVNYFIVATACKYYRGMSDEHSSMLLHIDLKKVTHAHVTNAMKRYIRDEIKPYCENQLIRDNLKNTWDKEKNKIALNDVQELFKYSIDEMKKYSRPEYDDIEYYVKQVINKLEVKLDNSDVKEQERLSYPSDHSVVYVVIGGNTLSRGLTLEGLIVSVFYRNSSLYDTLLQMGRWFGYRIGYEDLARIYTTPRIAFKYSELATVEENLRDEFEKYSLDITPDQVSARIRKMPSLQITRKKAMQAAISTGINYSGHRPSTLFFPHYDKEWLKHNIETTRKLLNEIDGKYVEKNSAFIFENISIDTIYKYVREMNIHEANQSCNKELILKFLDKAKDRNYLKEWNIAILSNIEQKLGVLRLRDDISVNLINRSRINRHFQEEETIYLKVLQQPNNMLIDTDIMNLVPDNTPIATKFIERHKFFEKKGMEEPGLMVIYPISKKSIPREKDEKNRLPIDTPEDVIGLMFTFPASKNIELDEYMTINLPLEMRDDE